MSEREAAWLDDLLQGLADRPFPVRVETICSAFLDTPYDLNPCGEGAAGMIDRRPIARYNLFNCITYAETVLALAATEEVRSKLHKQGIVVVPKGRAEFKSAIAHDAVLNRDLVKTAGVQLD